MQVSIADRMQELISQGVTEFSTLIDMVQREYRRYNRADLVAIYDSLDSVDEE